MRRAGGLVALVLTGTLAIGRMLVAGPHALDHVYGEDGWVFLTDRVTRGAGALDTGYAGYAHLVPRVLAAGSGLVPLRDYPPRGGHGRRGRPTGGGVVTAGAAAGPDVPAHPRPARARGVLIGVGLGLAYQAVVQLTGPMTGSGPARNADVRLGMIGSTLRALGGTTTAGAAVLGVVLLIAVGMVVATGFRRPGVAGLAAGAALFAVVPTVITGTVQSRYVGAAAALGFGAVVLAVAGRGAVVRVSALLVPVAVAAVAFPAAAYRVSGPRWSEQVVAADERCAAGAARDTLELSPASRPAAVLPCS